VRLWSLHPKYLDAPQLHRFREHPSPRRAIDAWLAGLHAEATLRGYSFDRSKIGPLYKLTRIPVTRGQIDYEWRHLKRKLARRSPAQLAKVKLVRRPHCHPLLCARPGPIAAWEKVSAPPKPTRRRLRKR
jgi:hypothetical protein